MDTEKEILFFTNNRSFYYRFSKWLRERGYRLFTTHSATGAWNALNFSPSMLLLIADMNVVGELFREVNDRGIIEVPIIIVGPEKMKETEEERGLIREQEAGGQEVYVWRGPYCEYHFLEVVKKVLKQK